MTKPVTDAELSQQREEAVRVRDDGKLCIEVAFCVHCEGLTIAPQSDECACGAELYPVTKTVALGERVLPTEYG